MQGRLAPLDFLATAHMARYKMVTPEVPWLSSPLHTCMLSHFSRVQLFVTLWTEAPQALLSMGIPQARILEWVAISHSRAPQYSPPITIKPPPFKFAFNHGVVWEYS